jgi:acyl carrier protein
MENYVPRVKAFIIENFLFGAADESLDEDGSFLQNGIIDSTGILEVVAWIEETFEIKVSDMDLLPENFDSVRRLADFIGRSIAAKRNA